MASGGKRQKRRTQLEEKSEGLFSRVRGRLGILSSQANLVLVAVWMVLGREEFTQSCLSSGLSVELWCIYYSALGSVSIQHFWRKRNDYKLTCSVEDSRTVRQGWGREGR